MYDFAFTTAPGVVPIPSTRPDGALFDSRNLPAPEPYC